MTSVNPVHVRRAAKYQNRRRGGRSQVYLDQNCGAPYRIQGFPSIPGQSVHIEKEDRYPLAESRQYGTSRAGFDVTVQPVDIGTNHSH
ncbi:hypothetical protein FHL15_003941 [Xylaria flabelliformis]|uniref:Uncharacterized protein n=1 Tax=Xylaria flabelliformis TaxID=2512241 RepID=A0A553I4W3_9PEZI|nr:hypothetical protein FHL15_003941 [Xylaria flabelliformis]